MLFLSGRSRFRPCHDRVTGSDTGKSLLSRSDGRTCVSRDAMFIVIRLFFPLCPCQDRSGSTSSHAKGTFRSCLALSGVCLDPPCHVCGPPPPRHPFRWKTWPRETIDFPDISSTKRRMRERAQDRTRRVWRSEIERAGAHTSGYDPSGHVSETTSFASQEA